MNFSIIKILNKLLSFSFQNRVYVGSLKLLYVINKRHHNNWTNFINFGHRYIHGLRTPREEIAFTARPKIQSQSQIFRYGGSIFCLPHRPNFSDIFDLCLHWVSVVRGCMATGDVPKSAYHAFRIGIYF